MVMAAERLKASAGSLRGARIVLNKAIPAQAGLAGGSSDAAATLVALDRLWDFGCRLSGCERLAAEIGSDVAFFIQAPAAVCRGRGERVEAVPLGNSYHFVLVRPPVGMSTADVYRQVVPPETASTDRADSAGACTRWIDGSGSKPVQPASTSRRGAPARIGSGQRRSGEPGPAARAGL